MHLGLFRLIKLFFASLFLQSSWSFHSMQTMGFLFNTSIGLDKKKKEGLLKNKRIFFNTHPYMAGYIIGAVLRAYDKGEDFEEIKKHLMIGQTAFASVGDTMFWQTIRPALLILAVITGLKFGWIGPLIIFILYNIIHLYHRAMGFVLGYEKGWDVVYILKEKRFTVTQRVFEMLGAFLVGLLPVILQKSLDVLFILPLVCIFSVFLWKRVAPLLILTFIFILIIIMLVVDI